MQYLLTILMASLIFTQSEDPFDISSTLEKIEEFGLPTLESLDALEIKAKGLYADEKWIEASGALQQYAKQLNTMANLVRSGLDPYYDASYDDRKEFPYEKIKPLIPYETLSNDYVKKRNIAYVMEAQCYVKLGETPKAAAMFQKALGLINIDNADLWEESRLGLYNIIGVK